MNVLITGVSKGLGLTVCEVLMEKGWNVYGISRSFTGSLEYLKDKYGEQFNWLSYDLSDINNIQASIFKNWISYNIPIHAYINNAAIAYDDIITNLRSDSLERMFHVNTFSPMIMTKYVIRQMLLHNIQGSIIHLSSISAHTGYKGLAMYASSKGALEAFSKNTSREWGEKKIRSNCIVAGFMETEMSSTLSYETKDRIYKRTSLKQPTNKRSVAETIQFLISDSSESITGQNIFIDSGTI